MSDFPNVVAAKMPEEKPDAPHMSFVDHLKDLRNSLVAVFIGIAVCSVLTLTFASNLVGILSGPLQKSFTGAELIGTSPAEAFMLKLQVGIYSAIVVSLPWTFYQVWKFIAPGLYPEEKKSALPFVFFTSVAFISGVLFCYYLVFPIAFTFFSGEFISLDIKPTIKVSEYLSFVLKSSLVFGFVFETPVLAGILGRLGLITDQTLLRNWRMAVVVMFILAAVLTPPDVASQLCLALPMCVLYALCIFILKRVNPHS